MMAWAVLRRKADKVEKETGYDPDFDSVEEENDFYRAEVVLRETPPPPKNYDDKLAKQFEKERYEYLINEKLETRMEGVVLKEEEDKIIFVWEKEEEISIPRNCIWVINRL